MRCIRRLRGAITVSLVLAFSVLTLTSPVGARLAAAGSSVAIPGVIATIPLKVNPTDPIYDSANAEVYFVNGDGNVSVLHGTTLLPNISLANPVTSLEFDPVNGFVYAMGLVPHSVDRGVVEVVSDGRQIANVSTDLGPTGLFDPFNGYVYVASYNLTNPYGQYGLVTVLNGTSVLGSFTVGTESALLTYDGRTGYVYVASGGENVTVLNGLTIVDTFSLNMTPSAAIYDGDDGYVYIAGSGPEITLVHGSTVVGTVVLPDVPDSCPPAFPSLSDCSFSPVDPRTGDLYVLMGNNVSVIRGTSLLSILPVACCTVKSVYDSDVDAVQIVTSPCFPLSQCNEADAVQLFNDTENLASLSLGVAAYPTGAAYDTASGDTVVITWTGCLVPLCGEISNETEKPGFLIVLGPPSAASASSGVPDWAYLIIGGTTGGFAVLAAAVINRGRDAGEPLRRSG